MHNSYQNLLSIQTEIKKEFDNKPDKFIVPNIIAVSKAFSLEHINPLIEAGHLHFGENKIQEAEKKWIDIKKATLVLSKLGKYNFGQGTVVRDNKVVAIEDRGGTAKMLQKCKIQGIKNTGVLVKFPKKKQDLRVDLPTVGLETLKQCKSSGLKGVVLKSKQNIFSIKNSTYKNIFLILKNLNFLPKYRNFQNFPKCEIFDFHIL